MGIIDSYKTTALVDVLLTARKRSLIPNTLCLRAPERHVQMGMTANLEHVNIEYCRERKIPIQREATGDSVSVMDENMIQIDLLSDSFPHDSLLTRTLKFMNCIVKSLQFMGLDAYVRQGHNDVLVKGKKISGTNTTLFNDLWSGSGGVLLGFDYDFCEGGIVYRPEKFANKEVKTHREYVTSIEAQLGREVSYSEVVSALRRGFETLLQVEFDVSKSLTEAEEQILEDLQVKYQSEEWLKRGRWSPVKEYWASSEGRS